MLPKLWASFQVITYDKEVYINFEYVGKMGYFFFVFEIVILFCIWNSHTFVLLFLLDVWIYFVYMETVDWLLYY